MRDEIKKMKEELNDLYDFVSAVENQGFGFSLGQTHDRIEQLEKAITKLEGE